MEDGAVVLEKTIASANINRQELAANLLPAIASSLTAASWNKTSLGTIVVGRGPGSFTSIRGAAIVARTLAYALRLPLIGLSRFEVVASCFEDTVGVVLSAYRQSCYTAVLKLAAGGQTQFIVEPTCVELSQLAQLLNSATQAATVRCFIVDPMLQLPDLSAGARIPLKPVPAINNSATRMAEIAWNRLSLKTGNPNDVIADDFPWKSVEPLYLREPSVTLKTP
jgi:tRNA threonylcarbamoyl adenosine modification protein YeaZ